MRRGLESVSLLFYAADFMPLDLPIQVCFPKPGRYTLQLWFFQEAGTDVLKMEQPFYVLKGED